MPRMQQLRLWEELSESEQVRLPPLSAAEPPGDPGPLLDVTAGSQPLPDVTGGGELAELELEPATTPPKFQPLRAAIDAGVFGITDSGPIEPDEHDDAALTQEHSHELITTLVEIGVLEDALRSGIDPRTGRLPRTPEAGERLAEHCRSELHTLQSKYGDMLAAFVEGFGPDAGKTLDEWARERVAGTPARMPYDPGHPWHYYWAGDGAEPLPLEQIPPADDAERCLEHHLPKNPAKRRARMHELLGSETRRLDEDCRRYDEVVTRGAEALSPFDRDIAYGGNDELAIASTIALKYNQIRIGLGRVRWLRGQLGHEHHAAHAADHNPPPKSAGHRAAGLY